MTAWNCVRNILTPSVTALTGAWLFLGLSIAAPGISPDAHAQSNKSGVVFGKRSFGKINSSDILRSNRRAAVDARNARIARERLARRGVIVGNGISSFDRHGRYFVRNKTFTSTTSATHKGSNSFRKSHRGLTSRDLQTLDRRRSIDARNERISLERTFKNAERAGAGSGVVVGEGRQGILTANNGGVAGGVYSSTTPCPRSHNCGYRLYSNGTGPRIITPGVPADNSLPAFDGLSGPQIITLD